ncbi:FAD-dependent oxidoreductase [Natronocalculus amylovorans]|uniref:Glycerol-3-phosphate dehydrogenase n=1 Tax=Natronocalculus amylovorans TaxID=2917812 RepID=A0AAE3FX12_9EURY|nr:FAD-dependent oxidoreductase [Natronocalculus amylovorans]MCL9817142.1 FAD-dependent oxidoreductase [Natronocalculus amylovorans]
MTHTTTALIIGGGATGVGIARDLALRGVGVTLVERSGLAGGTSGRSHGLLHSGARYAESDPRGAKECIEENEILRSIAGHCIRDSGGLFVQLDDDDPTYFEEKRDACIELGIPVTELSGDDARVQVPELSDDVVRALAVPDGVVYPSRLVSLNAQSAVDAGAEIFIHSPVTSITVSDERITAVSVGGELDETIEAEYVINATGAWAEQCAALAGVSVPMRPTKGVMVAIPYEGLDPVLNRCRLPADGDIIIPHDDQVVLGTTSVAVDDPDSYAMEDSEIEQMFTECAAMLPSIIGREAVRPYWGVRPLYAPDEDNRGTADAGVGNERGISRDFTLIDHTADGVSNFATIVGGKLTTYRQMAEAASDLASEKLGVPTASTTATTQMEGLDDPSYLDSLVDRYDARSPADADMIRHTV